MKDVVSGCPSSSAPARSSARTPSENISVQTRSPRCPARAASAASGTAPMPICKVAPSGTRSATRRPISNASGPAGAAVPAEASGAEVWTA